MTDLRTTLAAMRERVEAQACRWLAHEPRFCEVHDGVRSTVHESDCNYAPDATDTLRLLAAVEAVVARHKPAVFGDAPDVRYCTHCQASGDPFAPTGRTWPCPTIRTLTDALDGES